MDITYFNRITATYGLGVDEFLDLFAAQGHACAVCSTPLVLFSSSRKEKPVVDHDHETGDVRGILCHSCNIAVGWLEKDLNRTVRCASYLKNNRIGIAFRFASQVKDLKKKAELAQRRITNAIERAENEARVRVLSEVFADNCVRDVLSFLDSDVASVRHEGHPPAPKGRGRCGESSLDEKEAKQQ